MLSYKGYTGIVEYDPEGKIFTGEVIGTRSVISFQGRTPDELEQSFAKSIDLYLEMCKEDNIPPEKPYSGKFNIRITPELHKKIAVQAAMEKKSMNEWISEILEHTTR